MAKISALLDTIDKAMGSISFNMQIIPPKLLQCGVVSRPGISKIRTMQNVVKNMAAFGLPISENTDGTPNDAVNFASSIVNAVYDEILKNAVIQIPVPLGEATITVLGILT